jgi:hypothetical protein
MPLKLGRQFNRNYNMRVPFLDGFYNIGIFFDKKTAFLLFSIEADFPPAKAIHTNKVNMFKNLESSRFCETFLNLHNYRKNTLDISNQFKEIKPEHTGAISYILNETITLAKIDLDDREVFDTLNLYGLTLNSHVNEFLFLIAERHHIVTRLGKKIVRTTGLQIATPPSIEMLDSYHEESRTKREWQHLRLDAPSKTIKLSEIDKEVGID